ncbi:MAG: hypothetical protein LBD11_00630 [Candidatus Peribacteria bacterium]|jgi:hypothetical protein|nr:hypothetical protein [Candidatus Peribacteria bacterium]
MSLSIERKELRNKKLETLSKVSAQRRYLLEILNNIEKEEEMNKIHVDEGEIIIKTLDESKVKDKIRKTIHIIDSYVPDFQKFLNEEYLPQKEKAKFALYNKIKTRFKWGWKKGKGYGLETISNTISEVIKDVKLAQNADYQLQLLQDNDVKFFSNNGGESTVEKKEQLETTLTLDYQKKKRGASRIILDGIQNHLPGDSKGEHAYIHFFDEDQQQRISLKEAQQTSNRLSKIRFVDDGIGYDLKNLLFFFSTKENDKDAVGQFGEGIKMIATASLREGVEIEFESQNRRAKPTTKEVLLESNKSTRTMQQLCYDVEYLKRERPFIGSKTTFHNPSRELINLAKGV